MFRRNSKETDRLDDQIENLISQMENLSGDDPSYSVMADQVVKLQNLKNHTGSDGRLSADTILLAVTNLTGIALIMNHERAHIVTTKAFTLLRKAF